MFADAFASEELTSMIDAVYSEVDGGRWYFVQQGGVVWTAKPGDDALEKALDISHLLWLDHDEVGLMSVAVQDHPTEGPLLYAMYSVPDDEYFASRLGRFSAVAGDATTFNAATEEVILDLHQPTYFHQGNQVLFGPDGMLYASFGDGGRRDDAFPEGPQGDVLYSTIVRLDVDPSLRSTDRLYGIPADNPFANDEDRLGEIYAYGMRNPWRFSFDRENGELWAGDVGERLWEEVLRVAPGANYGWPWIEGPDCFEYDGDCDDARAQVAPPALTYNRDFGSSVTGGYVYRGEMLPGLWGNYVFADYIEGTVFAVPPAAWGEEVRPENRLSEDLVLLETGFYVTSFAEDASGELYVVRYRSDAGPALYRIAGAEGEGEGEAGGPAQLLRETGCFEPATPGMVVDGVESYNVAAELWSDSADKQRYFSLPPGGEIEVTETGDMRFPVGSVLIKEFSREGRALETRLFVHHDDGWAGYSWRWNESGDTAELVGEAGSTIDLGDGETWDVPSRSQCMRCHTEAAGFVLGPRVGQLLVDGEDQLERWRAGGLIEGNRSLNELRELTEQRADPFGGASLDARARSYLDANCAGCHQSGGTGRVNMDLRFGAAIGTLCNKLPELDAAAGPDARVIVPGAADDSVLFQRMNTRASLQMPPLGTHEVDEEGVVLIRQWIDAMNAECVVSTEGGAR